MISFSTPAERFLPAVLGSMVRCGQGSAWRTTIGRRRAQTTGTPNRTAGTGPGRARPPRTERDPALRSAWRRIKDMDRWLGDGGMELIGTVGRVVRRLRGRRRGPGLGRRLVRPDPSACNPHGIVQAGVHGLLLDAAMNFAINAALPGRDRTRATLEMKIETMRPARKGETYRLRGEVVRMARQVAYAEAGGDRRRGLVSRSTGTFLLHRPDETSADTPA